MGCKGKKRRERNYRKAHGAANKLPPPPDYSKLDALPNKLREIMAFTSPSNPTHEFAKGSKRKRKDGARPASEEKLDSEGDMKDRDDTENLQNGDGGDENVECGKSESGKKKRKRGQVEDLRFVAELENKAGRSKKKDRKKLLEERKKKHKKNKTGGDADFPGQEKIKFGDIVQAPPKLIAFPKARNSLQDASRERLRLQAVESYRNRKGWTSRPGIQLPSQLSSQLNTTPH